ncbi:KGG domain-containing protein [Methylocystis echinoides]|nr:KGG domain-containing protein [Methylocystis echinoides]
MSPEKRSEIARKGGKSVGVFRRIRTSRRFFWPGCGDAGLSQILSY